uniref:ATP synthase subunit a n=1 Tax=Draco maculatus TaxID=89026 RepID=A0A6F8CTS1_9SAUR|nr:ATP synthase F0 subunit 6 [Draco maculatus]
MTLNLFDQFLLPQLFNINLLPMAMLPPLMLVFTNSRQLKNNRFVAITTWLMKKSTKTFMAQATPPAHKWSLMLITLASLLFATNMMGILPYTYTPTTQLSMNMALATPLWLATVLMGFRNHPSRSLAHLVPEGSPTPLIPILIIIETISLFIRPVSLGVRLTANLTAGHLLLHLTSLATFSTAHAAPAALLIPATLLILLTTLEIAVALIQAYVFSLLISLYLQENS